MRIGCSKLKGDLHNNLHVVQDSICQCGAQLEDAEHYFIYCPLFINMRAYLQEDVTRVGNFNINTLLFGDKSLDTRSNERLFKAVHKYIIDTGRFD